MRRNGASSKSEIGTDEIGHNPYITFSCAEMGGDEMGQHSGAEIGTDETGPNPYLFLFVFGTRMDSSRHTHSTRLFRCIISTVKSLHLDDDDLASWCNCREKKYASLSPFCLLCGNLQSVLNCAFYASV